MALQSFVEPWPLFQFLNLYTDGRTPWRKNQPVARPRPAHRTAQTSNKYIQTSMPQVGFEPTIPVFELAKTVHALDGAATVSGFVCNVLQSVIRTYEAGAALDLPNNL
jgi:hypothetical protein